MASAKRTEIETVVAVPGITLTLTEDEAAAVLTVLQFVGGHPKTTRRGLVDKVAKSLDSLRVSKHARDVRVDPGGVRFHETPPPF